MNFTAVRGFNAYAQFTAKIREAVKADADGVSTEIDTPESDSITVYSEPVDIVTISKQAKEAGAKLAEIRDKFLQNAPAPFQDNPVYSKFREWLRTARPSGMFSSSFTQKVSGSVMNDALAGSGITVGDDEEYNINIDTLSALTVSSKNAEKAKAIQDLLSQTPIGINWGLLLATLPPR